MAPFLVLLVASTCLADKFNHYKYGELKGFRLIDSIPYSILKSNIPGNVKRTYSTILANSSKEEVAEIDLRFRVHSRTTQKLVYNGPTFTIKDFANITFNHGGSLLPACLGRISSPVVLDYPGKYWTPDTYDMLEVTAIRTFKGPQDLHDLGHLFSKFNYIKESEAMAILKKDPSLCKTQNLAGLTAGHVMIMTQHPQAIEFVLKNGGSISKPTRIGMNMMDFASLSSFPDTIEYIVKKGGNVNQIEPEATPLIRAASVGNMIGVKWMLAHGAKPDLEIGNGNIPAHAAIYAGYPEVLTALVKAGAKPKGFNRFGLSWMHAATGNVNMFNIVKKYGISFDVVNPQNGMTPLLYSVSSGRFWSIRWLLQHGANPNVKDKQGKSIYDYAKKTNTLNTDRFLRQEVETFSTYRQKK